MLTRLRRNVYITFIAIAVVLALVLVIAAVRG
jgi:hypothetical protein